MSLPNFMTAIAATTAPPPRWMIPTGDPRYHATILRIAGDAGYSIPGGFSWWRDARHHYSKDQPWDHGGNFIKLEQKGGHPGQLILDAHNFRPVIVSERPPAPSEPQAPRYSPLFAASYETRWRPRHAGQMVSWLKKSQELVVWDVTTEREVWRVRIPGPVDSNFGFLSEGCLSYDGRFVVLATSWPRPQSNGKVDYFQVIDLEQQRVGPVNLAPMRYVTDDAGDVDWCSISAGGGYVVTKYSSTGRPEYARVFKVHTDLSCTPQLMDASGLRMVDVKGDRDGYLACLSHGALGIAPDGREIYVGGVRQADTAKPICSDGDAKKLGRVIAQDLATGLHWHVSAGTEMLGMAEAPDQHVSACCYDRPGWALVKYERAPGKQYSDEVTLWKLDGSRACVRFGVTHSDESTYRGEAHAVPNPQGTAGMFASNWRMDAIPQGPAVEDVKAYIIS